MTDGIQFGSPPLDLIGTYEFVYVSIADEHQNIRYYYHGDLPVSVPDIIIHEDQTVGFIY